MSRLPLLALLLFAAQDPTDVAARVTVEVKDADLSDTGTFTLKLTFDPEEPIKTAYALRLEVRRGPDILVRRDHAPKTPTKQWTKGKKVTYDVSADFPLDADLSRAGDTLDVCLAFYDPKTDTTLPPRGAEYAAGNFALVGKLRTPKFAPALDSKRVDAAVDRAKALAKEGRGADAWNVLETSLRLSEHDPTKKRLAQELIKIGTHAPEPLSGIEEGIVVSRIGDEKERYFRLVAGQMNDAGELHGALRILEAIGGKLEEQAESAVIGAVDDAKRNEQDITQIELRLKKQISPDDLKVAEAEFKKYGATDKLLKRANAYADQKKLPIALWLMNQLCRDGPADVRAAADPRALEIEEAWLKATPPEQQAKVDAALNHPVWARTSHVYSHQFIFIGPKEMVNAIPRDSMVRYDVAYVLLTDFFGRRPNPGGDRVSVYFKELWNFGGATGGGTQINVGRADPAARGTRVDTGLMYHELTHCIDDVEPTFAGFHEGLADLGVAFTLDSMGEEEAADGVIKRYLDAFKNDFVDRALDYWLIPEYAPSAGFFVHFIEKYGKAAEGREWQRYRRFFRDYRDAPVRDGREPAIIRAIAFYLMKHFGDAALDDLISFRFPLTAADGPAIKREMEIYDRGPRPLRRSEADDFKGVPLAPAPRDALYAELLKLYKNGSPDDDDVRKFGAEKLGIVHTWITTGPFKSPGFDCDAFVFPPEYEIDFSKTYTGGGHAAQWVKPDPSKMVHIDPTGWVEFAFTYRDDSAFYAMCNVLSDKERDAVVHIRADDDATVFVDGALAGKYRSRWDAGSMRVNWRGPVAKVTDAMRWPVKLRAGRSKVLVKVRNHGGDCGFVLALTDPNGDPFPDLKTDADAPMIDEVVEKKRTWTPIIECPVANAALNGAFQDVMGGFTLKDKRLVGTTNARNIPWRKYTVRPGFPQDHPSNLAWLKESATKSMEDFDLVLAVDTAGGGPPKFAITFQGEGENDPLSGWTVMLHPRDGDVVARVEQYDQLVYLTAGVPVKFDKDHGPLAVRLRYEFGRLSLAVGDTKLLDRAPLRAIPGKHRFGLTTWDPDTRLAGLVLRAAK